MKVLMLNGSPRFNGNTARCLDEMAAVFAEEGVESERVDLGIRDIRGCIACARCRELGHCVFDDEVNVLLEKFAAADGLVVASPVYYASANGNLISALDRLFYSAAFDMRDKVGASVAVARRAGTTATIDELNKYFSISGMPIAGSQYWNVAHGCTPGEVAEDAEGLQTMRTLARNMVFLMKSIALGKEAFGLPAREEVPARTNFVR